MDYINSKYGKVHTIENNELYDVWAAINGIGDEDICLTEFFDSDDPAPLPDDTVYPKIAKKV